ncbi:MAG: preprotein translocase subunit SecA [Parcubacteria group bacterium CG10_big_fil_rev_8_21_14_0_10_36_14]|nr:MAG: preprotein translocase subunit SecA [Parcubacteria group bacterium CG10_big_fil_rev_8_21_14_0_10_36_14]
MFFSDPNKKALKKIQPFVNKINELEPAFEKMSDFDLQNKSKELKTQAQEGKKLDDILSEAFALVREAAKRTLGQRHFDVQLLGGIVLHNGEIAEMKTGEGKTLTSTLAIYLNALAGKGVHVVTVNDYLSRRDAIWMGQIFGFLGLSVGIINHMQSFLYDASWKAETLEEAEEADRERDLYASFRVNEDFLRPCSRKESYDADITYGTNNEFGFDYLRDNMATRLEDRVQRNFYYAIVDEVDSILIDEARTPLIISAPAEESGEMYARFARIVKNLKENEDYNLDLKMRAVTLTDVGIDKIEKALNIPNIYAEGGIKMVHHLEQALKAETLFHRDKDYVLRDGEVFIVDEFTGRLMPGRRYSEGLHQAIEAKEGVKVQRENQTLASVTFQNYFRMYEKLGGMTGTALTEAEEFSKIYFLETVAMPTNKPLLRKDLADRIYKNKKGKIRAVIEEVKELQAKGQPVLVGTVSVEENEEFSEKFEKAGICHEILNAKNHAREAEIIAQAGKKGAVTLATNMAGRGVDIVLGGAPYNEKTAEEIRALGGLVVIGTERHESRRIDNQLRGRAGRQGDPGYSRFYVSLEDELMRIFAAERISYIMEKLGLPEDTPIENGMVSKAIESAQKKVEGHNFDIRKHLLEYDDVINRHREAIYSRRRNVLEQNDIKEDILKIIENELEQVIVFHTSDPARKNWNLEEIWQVANTIFPLEKEILPELLKISSGEGNDNLGVIKRRDAMVDLLVRKMREAYEKMEGRMIEQSGNPDILRQIEKGLSMRVIDTLWISHLEEIDYLRTSIGLRGIAGKDPLVEFKREAYRLWNELQSSIDKQMAYSIFKIELAQNIAPQSPFKNQNINTPLEEKEKIGRNEPCSCGSGKKYKKCCGA